MHPAEFQKKWIGVELKERSAAHEPGDNTHVIAISNAARELNERRERWLNSSDAAESQLKKRTLTNLYNDRPEWLSKLHRSLDRAVWAAYGWDDEDPASLDEDVILARLLALNLERARVTEGGEA